MNRIIIILLTASVVLCGTTCAYAQVRGEYLITNHGAKGDASFDNAPIINDLINRLPDTGGTIVIPHGNFRINGAIVVRKSFVTIRGLGRGSKILVGPGVLEGIVVPGDSPDITGMTIRDLHIAGLDWNVYQTGLTIDRRSDSTRIDNVAISTFHKAIFIRDMGGGQISGCSVAQCETGLHMVGGSDNIVTKNRLSAFSGGIAVELAGLNRVQFSANNIAPDGHTSLWLRGADNCNISGNTIRSYYTGAIRVDGNMNSFSGNTIAAERVDGVWPSDPQGRDGLWGLVQITGNDNSFTSSSIMSWQPDNDVRINVLRGDRNAVRSVIVAGGASDRKISVDPATNWTRITNSGWPQEINLNGTPTARVTYDP